MTWLAVGSGVIAIAALAFAVYAGWSARSDAKDWANQLVTAGKLQIEAERNGLTYQQQRDTEKARADKAEAELADATAQLKATQEALAKVSEKDADEVAAAVRSAPDASDALDGVLASSARSDVPDATDAGTADGHQG